MQAMILAGGKGTRLRPFTLQNPKPLLPLLEVPFLVWMVERCREVGITDILMSVGYLGHQVEAFFRSGENWGVKIRYIQEDSPLDTAGALTLARPYFTGDPLVVFNADILTDLDLLDLVKWHQDTGSRATLTLTRVTDITAYGLVETDRTLRIESFREKPSPEEAIHITTNTINAGTYVLDPNLLASYAVGEPLSFERKVFPNALQQGEKMMAYIHEGYWRDLGTPASYYHGQLDILTGKMQEFPCPQVQSQASGIWIHETAEVSADAQLEAPCYVGSYTKLGANTVLSSGTIVGSHCWINRRLEPGVYASGTLAV